MRKFIAAIGVASAVLTAAAPQIASAQSYERHVERRSGYARYSRHTECRRVQHRAGNQGTVAGALVGGASGALIGHNALGALVGAGVGAVGGHEIAKSRVRC